jgi:hypothetical protein
MGDIIDAVKKRFDYLDKTYNPMRRVGDAIAEAGQPKNESEAATRDAVAMGAKARNEAIARGRAPDVPVQTVDDSIKKIQ